MLISFFILLSPAPAGKTKDQSHQINPNPTAAAV